MQKIYSVDSVTVAVLDSKPRQLLVTCLGQVVSSGWSDARLQEHSAIELSEGILQFDFVAQPPPGLTRPAWYPVVAHHLWPGDVSRLRGVRVHAAANQAETHLGEKVLIHPVVQDTHQLGRFDSATYPKGIADGSSQPSPPSAQPATDEPLPVLLGGELRKEAAISGEGTGLFLFDVLVELDASAVEDAEDHVGELVVAKGKFELMRYPRRGGVWTFVANELRPHR